MLKDTSRYELNIRQNEGILKKIFGELEDEKDLDYEKLTRILINNPSDTGKTFSKAKILIAANKLKYDLPLNVKNLLQTRKIRSLSGVTPVTVLTKPFPCPGKCIFCPNDVRMPKSYMSDEPGAQRAYINKFDPYYQTFNRLVALRNMGHPTDKIELIILGGTWSSYSEAYQVWFVKRCFDAMNEFSDSTTHERIVSDEEMPLDENLLTEVKGEAIKDTYNKIVSKALNAKISKAKNEVSTWEELYKSHLVNETAKTRCIGLVIETRPDEIDKDEILRIRKLGATKVQIGIQSLNDKVLSLNKRGHDVDQTRTAINMLRQAGFKIHAHWMPNLYGSNPNKDIKDYKRLFRDISIRPDELKVYPCSLIGSAELMHFYNKGLWKPYSHNQLLRVLVSCFRNTQRYCRLTRVIRDIPSTDIVVGNKITNFREVAEKEVEKRGFKSLDIRSREIKSQKVSLSDLSVKKTKYKTKVSQEIFIEYVTKKDEIAGFLRLSLPTKKSFVNELDGNAIIREVHVYGQSVDIGMETKGAAQHIGLGRSLINIAIEIAKLKGYKGISVISSVGTREYYKKLGFKMGPLYQNITF